jgi:Domain of unknown function (DUF4157)
MRTFSRQQAHSQTPGFSTPARPHTAKFGPACREHPLLRLQRTLGNQAVLRKLQIQTKLTVSQPGDDHEREADRISADAMSMPEPQVRRACGCGGGCHNCQSGHARHTLQTEPVLADGLGQTETPPIVRRVLATPGEALDQATRRFMEPRLGANFAHVRVHTGSEASKSAGAVGARAYTLGSHIVFGSGEYSPESSSGRTLLSHELVHVMQQGDGRPPGIIQRREVDDRSCAGLPDIESDVDTEVNHQIASARTAALTPTGSLDTKKFAENVFNQLGLGIISPIESFVEHLPPSKRRTPPGSLAGTKYSGTPLALFGSRAVASAANVHSVCIGADKLGHFFDLGFRYWAAAGLGATPAQIESLGRGSEMTVAGLALTGVFSNADLEANRKGWKFYDDLTSHASGFTFAIKDYITDQWNEQVNPSFYSSAMADVVWSNLLTGSWRGTIVHPGPSTVAIQFALTATSSSVSGTYEWPAGSASPQKGKIKNGTITQVTTPVSGLDPTATPPSPISATPVIGIKIEFDWERATYSGKGVLNSVNEQTLEGTWGYGASRTDGGALHVKKV